MAGLMADAERIKFVFGEDSMEKMKARIVLLEKCARLPASTRAELVAVLYGYVVNEVPDLVMEYIRETMPQLSEMPMGKLFNIWYRGVINRERRDLKIVLKKMQEG